MASAQVILKRVERLWQKRCDVRSHAAKTHFGKLAKTYSSNVVSVVKTGRGSKAAICEFA
ncbi:hypothetical protein GTQ43_29065 [Nostoc sp. KVJ3]|uniref:hypothetical protein n=1 Tax=Nostoc sp. KVJ3 TaxID=457945 RepID=UPI0022382A83|nr:hypothetical protein [Nostoc sp. KVJ3]MCW5317680.1 hypothetical protein [Nostoc sp. KVJ3]